MVIGIKKGRLCKCNPNPKLHSHIDGWIADLWQMIQENETKKVSINNVIGKNE